MAKRPTLDPEKAAGLFEKTGEPEQPTQPQEQAKDKVYPLGIGLKKSEWTRLQVIADELGVKRHNLAMWVLRDFMRRYDAGERPATTQKTVLKMP